MVMVEEPHQRVVYEGEDDPQPLSLATIRHYDNDVFLRPSSQPAAIVSMCGHTYEIDSTADFRSVLHPGAEMRVQDRFQQRVPSSYD